MKHLVYYCLLLFTIVLVQAPLNVCLAQPQSCGFAEAPKMNGLLNLYDPEIASSNFCIKVYFILYGDKDQNGDCVDLVPFDRQNSIINDLNDAFPASIQFYYDENETEIVCGLDLIDSSNACDYLNQDFGIQKPTDGIIIHLGSDQESADTPGFAKSIPSKEFYVGGTLQNIPSSLVKGLLAHEMGHCLGLHHTFLGEPDCETSRDCNGVNTDIPKPGTFDGITDTGRDPEGTANTNCTSLSNPNQGTCMDDDFNYDNIPFNNYMSYYWDCMQTFSDLQILKMKFTVQNMFGSNPTAACCALPANADHTIYSGQTDVWNSDRDVSKVVIEQGAELRIQNATISFDADGRIENNGGKLILNNATLQLSPACGENQWLGIKSTDCAGEIIINNSTVQDAAVGIHLDNIIDCQSIGLNIDFSSLIKNCSRGILIENSTAVVLIHDTQFEYNTIALEAIETENINIENCLFDNNGSVEPDFAERGISLINTKIRFLKGNTFDNTAMIIKGTHPQASRVLIGEPDKDRCVFQSDNPNTFYFISSSGVDGDMGLMIENTFFKDASYANIFWGSNSYTIKRSEFNDVLHSSFIVNTGSSLNSHQCNVFNKGSLVYNGLNESSDFLENDFKFSKPVFIRPDWRTNSQILTATKTNIGTSQEGAANCFDFKSNALGVTADYGLTYHYFDDSQTTNCQEINGSQKYDKKRVLDFINNCQNNGIFIRINPDGDFESGILYDTDWNTHITSTQVLNKISHYQEALSAAHSAWQTNIVQIQSIQDTLDEWVNYALFRAERTNNPLLAIQGLTSLDALKYRKKLVGVYLEEEMYNEAEVLLNSMNSEDTAEALFKEVQGINLRYLKEQGSDSLEYVDIERLKEISYQPYPAAGFAYGLYHKLTGKLLELPLDKPDYSFQSTLISPRTEPLNSTNKSFVFPNPGATDVLIKSNQAFSKVEIYSISGKKVVDKEMGETSNYKFHSSELASGLYIIQLSNNGQFVDHIKFVKQ